MSSDEWHLDESLPALGAEALDELSTDELQPLAADPAAEVSSDSPELDLGELAEVDFVAPQLDELPELHIEPAAEQPGEALPDELPALSSDEWHLDESLPALGAEALEPVVP